MSRPARKPTEGQQPQAEGPQAPTARDLDEVVGFKMRAPERARMVELLRRIPQSKSDWIRHFMEVHQHLESALAPIIQPLEAYAVHARLTVPAQRRKIIDWEWTIDALVQLAAERLDELQRDGTLPAKAAQAKPPGRTP